MPLHGHDISHLLPPGDPVIHVIDRWRMQHFLSPLSPPVASVDFWRSLGHLSNRKGFPVSSEAHSGTIWRNVHHIDSWKREEWVVSMHASSPRLMWFEPLKFLMAPNECCWHFYIEANLSNPPNSDHRVGWGPHHGVSVIVPQIDPSVPQSVVQSRRRPLLGPSPGWKRLLPLSHLRHY